MKVSEIVAKILKNEEIAYVICIRRTGGKQQLS